jgi:cytochrome c oxidase subunit IV
MSSETREIMHDQHTHPGNAVYVKIGVVLTILTAIEIAAYYVEDQLGGIAAPLILVLSAAKFILVVLFYMHLKYDSRAFTGIFLFPFTLGVLVIVSLILLYHVLHPLR